MLTGPDVGLGTGEQARLLPAGDSSPKRGVLRSHYHNQLLIYLWFSLMF